MKGGELTSDEAKALLPDGDEIHTFINPGAGVIVGADWDRSDILDAIDAAKSRKVGGEQCRNMGHGLVIEHGGRWLFIETKKSETVECQQQH